MEYSRGKGGGGEEMISRVVEARGIWVQRGGEDMNEG